MIKGTSRDATTIFFLLTFYCWACSLTLRAVCFLKETWRKQNYYSQVVINWRGRAHLLVTNIQQPALKIYTQVILYRLIDCIFIFRITFVYTNKYEETTKETLGHEFEITRKSIWEGL